MNIGSSGVRAGNSRSGTNAFVAVGAASGWFYDISQALAVVPNQAYRLEYWIRSETRDCTVLYGLLGTSNGRDTTTTYERVVFDIPPATQEQVTRDNTILLDIYCNAGFGPDYAVYVDDVTLTAV